MLDSCEGTGEGGPTRPGRKDKQDKALPALQSNEGFVALLNEQVSWNSTFCEVFQ